MLRRACGVTHRDVERLFAQIAMTIDRDRLRRLHAAHRDAPFDLVEACDHERKLRIAIVKAMLEGLQRARPLRILDLGHGGGYFVTVCRHLGHTAHGTEVPVDDAPVDYEAPEWKAVQLLGARGVPASHWEDLKDQLRARA